MPTHANVLSVCCAECFLADAIGRLDDIHSQSSRVQKALVKTQLFMGVSLSGGDVDSHALMEDPVNALFGTMLQLAEAHSQASEDIVEWKRIDGQAKRAEEKGKSAKYMKRTSRLHRGSVAIEDVSLAHFSSSLVQASSKQNYTSATAAGGGGDMLSHMKAQMELMRSAREQDLEQNDFLDTSVGVTDDDIEELV